MCFKRSRIVGRSTHPVMKQIKTAEIIVVGSEFFSRDKRDTNSIWLTEELEKRGIRIVSKSIVADELEALSRVVLQGLTTSDFVISTGGLGPTEDDRTREAVAKALELELRFHEDVVEELKLRYARRGREMAENNRRQAYFPEGALVVANPTGTAPGFACQTESSRFLALPGPPREMQGMFLQYLEDHQENFNSDEFVLVRQTLRVTGLGESDMDRKISHLYKDLKNPEVTINFTPHDLEIHLTAKASDTRGAEEMMQPLIEAIKKELEGYLFSDCDQGLAEVVVSQLQDHGLTLAAAESVTGGHLAHKICSVPGASAVFLGSVVAYHKTCKETLLGVDADSLKQHSAVSEQVAQEMAEGARARTGADLALSCTGYAGPGGGTEADPVGTVYLGFSTPEKTTVRRISLPGSRNLVRSRTTQALLFKLFRYLRKQEDKKIGAR